MDLSECRVTLNTTQLWLFTLYCIYLVQVQPGLGFGNRSGGSPSDHFDSGDLLLLLCVLELIIQLGQHQAPYIKIIKADIVLFLYTHRTL